MNDVAIRLASVDDAEELLKIYAYYVEHTAVSFEYDVPAPSGRPMQAYRLVIPISARAASSSP